MCDAQLFLTPGRKLTEKHRMRLLFCLGMGSTIQTPSLWPSPGQTLEGQIVTFNRYDLYYIYARNVNLSVFPVLAQFNYAGLKKDLVPSLYRYFDNVARPQVHDKIYIRSSLRVNIVDEAGRRSDILQIVPSLGY